jgi:transposase
MEPGTPFGASVQRLATSLRYTHAIRDARLSALLAQVFGLDSRAGGLATVLRSVKGRLDQRVAASLPRWRSRRLLGSDATRARVHGRQPWEWVLPHTEVCIHGIRPSRGQGVRHEVLGTPRPTTWVSALYRAHKHHPAEPWQVCLAPHVREGPCALDAGDLVFAARMQRVLRRALAIPKRRDTRAASTLYQYPCDLRRRVPRCVALPPTNPHGRRLPKRDAKIQENLCRCLEEATMPPTKHASAQAIRLSTVCRNVTHGSRADGGRALCAAVPSVVNTGKRPGLSAFQAIQRALSPVGSLFDLG